MSRRRVVVTVAAAVAVAVVGGALMWRRMHAARSVPAALVAPRSTAPTATPLAHIGVTVFYVAAGGDYLVPVHREVPLASDTAAQGREVVLAQLEPATPPLASPIPPGTTLRGFFITAKGDAYVDLSGEAIAAHRGGTTAELLTVYAIVHAVTTSLPAAHRVQVLVNGAEVDSLAGHVDVRRPLTPDPALVAPVAAEGTRAAPPTPQTPPGPSADPAPRR